MVGNIEAIDDAIASHKKYELVMKIMGVVLNYFSCKIKF